VVTSVAYVPLSLVPANAIIRSLLHSAWNYRQYCITDCNIKQIAHKIRQYNFAHSSIRSDITIDRIITALLVRILHDEKSYHVTERRRCLKIQFLLATVIARRFYLKPSFRWCFSTSHKRAIGPKNLGHDNSVSLVACRPVLMNSKTVFVSSVKNETRSSHWNAALGTQHNPKLNYHHWPRSRKFDFLRRRISWHRWRSLQFPFWRLKLQKHIQVCLQLSHHGVL